MVITLNKSLVLIFSIMAIICICLIVYFSTKIILTFGRPTPMVKPIVRTGDSSWVVENRFISWETNKRYAKVNNNFVTKICNAIGNGIYKYEGWDKEPYIYCAELYELKNNEK